MMRPEDRYRHDAVFRNLVDMLRAQLEQPDGIVFTPTELREAVLLASTMYEYQHVRPLFVLPDGSSLITDADRWRHEQMGSWDVRYQGARNSADIHAALQPGQHCSVCGYTPSRQDYVNPRNIPKETK